MAVSLIMVTQPYIYIETLVKIYKEQKNDTKNGTEKSTITPCIIAMNTMSLPEYLVMIGNVVSIVVAPPAHIGANFPKYFTINGVNNRVNNSLIMLASKAMVPSSVAGSNPIRGVSSLVIKIEERE